MIDFRPILFVIGILLTTLATGMFLPAVMDWAVGNPDWQVFLVSAAITLFLGICMILSNQTEILDFTIHQAFLLTTLSWIVIALFASLPFMFANLGLSFTDAFFEAMSGVTTTGSTVITGLDYAPPGILLWRALLQWLGGIGIIVMAIAVLPMLRVGGMQLFRMESSDTSEKVMPRVAEIASGIGIIYVTLTLACATLLWFSGMDAFQAIAHAMSTISTGGFSTFDGSIGHFGSAAIETVTILFMLLGGMPFALYIQAVRGKPGKLFKDSQVIWFLCFVAIIIAVLTLWQCLANGNAILTSLRFVAFNVVSVITTSGFVTTDYGVWGGFAVAMFFFLTVIGGCSGSTSGGIKIFRFQVIYETAHVQIRRLLQPHGVFIPNFNNKPIPADFSMSVMGFFFLFALTFTVLALALSFLGLDFLTSMSGAASALANVGPGLGDVIGPTGNFTSLPDAAKWLLCIGMLIGRLELYTVLVLFAPAFWRA